MSKIFTCVIADDHAVVRLGISFLLNRRADYRLLAAVENTFDLLTIIKKEQPDILILDVDIPGPTIHENIINLRQLSKDLKIVIYSINDDLSFQNDLLFLGADAFVSKNELEESLLQVIDLLFKIENKH